MTFEFSIENPGVTLTKNISLLVLPNFNGLPIEGLYTYIFEFDVLRKRYYYTLDSYNMKLFPSTLKNTTLHWFMGLKRGTIHNLD